MNKYQKAHPEWFDEKGRVQPWVLRELLDYNPETGELLWKERDERWFSPSANRWSHVVPAAEVARKWNSKFSKVSAGCIKKRRNGERYITVSILGCNILGMSLVFAMQNGEYCDGGVFTKNGDATDLRYHNLDPHPTLRTDRIKEAAFFRRGKSSAYFGVAFSRSRNRWIARILFQKKKMQLGSFKTEEEAADAYDRAALKYLGPTAYLNMAIHPEPASAESRGIFIPPPGAAPVTETDDF